jgi:hypothetical protein
MAEALFNTDHQYIDFLVNNVHLIGDLNGKKHYNIFVDYTANEEDTKHLYEHINMYNIAYEKAKNDIVDGKDECQREKYSHIMNPYPVNFTKDKLHFETICDSTLLPYRKGDHMKYERVFLDPAVFKKAVNINNATPSDLLKSMTEFFANDEIYEYFDDVRVKRMKAGLCVGKDYLIEINGSTEKNRADSDLIREYKDVFGQVSAKGPHPLGCIYLSAKFDYDEAYSMLDKNDRELLDIISEFRLKQIMHCKFLNNASHDNSKLGFSATYLDDDIHIHAIKTFMGRRLYSNYSYFIRAKECDLSAKKLIKLFNNVIAHHNYLLWSATNVAVAAAPVVSFQATFWENLKRAKTSSLESN